MEELRQQAVDVLSGLSEEQLLMVLAYAQCLKDGEEAIPLEGFVGFAEESA
jgi:hypothetical protein